MEALRFEPLTPTQVIEARRHQHEMMRDHTSMSLLRLAACATLLPVEQPDGGSAMVNGISGASIVELARSLGPLLAREPFARGAAGEPCPPVGDEPAAATLLVADQPFDEPCDIWGSAAVMAHFAVALQEFVGGALPLSALSSKLPELVKRLVVNPETGSSFSLVVATLNMSPLYASWLGVPAFVRREEFEGRIDYSFLLRDDDDPLGPVDLVVASFSQEITTSDYRVLSAACGISAAVDAEVKQRLGLDASDARGGEDSVFGLGGSALQGQDLAMDEADIPRLRSMVRALIAAHMRDARVDLFSADEETGYLAFDSLLSWLWYGFSRELDLARIRYCAYCGKAFPLVGHRGPDKLFCSIECKNAARNKGMSQRRRIVREQFREQGASVAELAERHFREEGAKEGQRRVREALSSWPTLKHDIDDDISEHGWTSPLLKRCRDEGLDLERLLPARRKAELKRLGDTVSR